MKIEHLLISGIKSDTDKQMADHFNAFFASVDGNIANNLTQPVCNNDNDLYDVNMVHENIFLIPTNNIEVYDNILKLKNESGGVDLSMLLP